MKPISVFFRLGVAFALLIVITLWVGWLGLAGMARMNATLNEILEKRYSTLIASQEALRCSSVNNRITMQVFLVEDPKQIEILLAERAENTSKISTLIKQIEGQLEFAQEKKLMADLMHNRMLYMNSYQSALELLVKEKKYEDARRTLIDQTLPLLVAYHASWQAFVDFQAAKAREAGTQAAAQYFSARKLLARVTTIAIALASVIAFFATRAIAKEIRARQEMQSALREAQEQLEEKVLQRTSELSKSNRELTVEIGQRKQAEIALRESEVKFRAIFEGSNDAIMLLSPAGFCDCNPRTLEMFRVNRKENFLNLQPSEVSPAAQPDGMDSLTAAHEHIRIAYEQGHTRFEWVHRRSNGEDFPCEVLLSTFEFFGEMLIHATVREISERKQMEAALARERNQFQNLMDFIPDNIYFKDRQSRFLLVNKAYAKNYGLSSPEELQGKTDFDVFGNEHSQQAYACEQELMTTGVPIIGLEEKEDHVDGTITWVSTTKVPVRDSEGNITGLVGISRDVTDRKRAETSFMESASKYQNLIESVSDWVWEADSSLHYIFSNQKVKSVLGYDLDRVLGLSVIDLVPGIEQIRVTILFEEIVREKRREIVFDFLCLHSNGDIVTLEMNVGVIFDASGSVQGFRGIARDVTERRRFEEELRKLSRAMDQSPASVVITDIRGRIEYVNPRFCELTGYTAQEVRGKNPSILNSGKTPKTVIQQMWATISSGREWRGEFCNRKKNGDLIWESAVISPIKNEDGVITHFLGTKEDITERKRLEKEREIMELQLRQAQKLESVGQLAAGIAHEINTPIQYVGDNLRFIQDSFGTLSKLITEYEKTFSEIPPNAMDAKLSAAIESARNEADFSYLAGEIPTAIQQSLDGVRRVADIVRAMKEFSHPGGKEKSAIDINRAIQTTVTVARNEWKYVAEVVTELAPDLPMVPCFPDEFNQVILNLLVNAAHAIGDVVKKQGGKGAIRITTKRDDPWVEIRVADTGTGIPEEIRHRIFELFFTTKEVGKGTGQGLALARSVIVTKHGGVLTFESSVGRGTTFIVRLPVTPPTTSEPGAEK